MLDEILGCKPCVLNGKEFTVRKADQIMDVESRRQIKRQSELQKGARRLRCLEHLARTEWKGYGRISGTRNKHKPFQSEPVTEDVTRLKLKQTSTTGHDNLPPINEPGCYFLERDVNVPLSARAPIVPVRGMLPTAHLLKKFRHPQQEQKILYDPHRTNKGQRCKYTKSMKMPTESWLLGCYKGTRDKQLESASHDAGYSVENDVDKKHSSTRKQVHVPLSKLRKFPTASNTSPGNGVLKVIYTKSKISRGGVPVVPNFDFEFQTSNCAMKQVIRNTADRRTTTGKDVQREKTEVVMQNANRLLKLSLKPEINSSQGSTDAKRTLSENPDPREVDRILRDDPLSNHPYPDDIQNPDGKLIVWPKESSSMNTADSTATHKLPEVLRNLPKTHVNLKHKVQDWIDNHLECSYSLE